MKYALGFNVCMTIQAASDLPSRAAVARAVDAELDRFGRRRRSQVLQLQRNPPVVWGQWEKGEVGLDPTDAAFLIQAAIRLGWLKHRDAERIGLVLETGEVPSTRGEGRERMAARVKEAQDFAAKKANLLGALKDFESAALG